MSISCTNEVSSIDPGVVWPIGNLANIASIVGHINSLKDFNNMYENDMNEQKIFELVFEHFQNRFAHLNLEMVNPYGPRRTIVSMNGEMQFNTDGYNLLYNLTRLCDTLKEELR